jgi:phosphoglycerate dehydrogenase-like enzyme
VTTPFLLNYEDPKDLFRPLPEEAHLQVRLDVVGARMTEGELIQGLSGVVAVIAGAEPYTPRVFESAASLRIVSRSGVGLNSIDLDAATASGVVVTHAAGKNAVSVAEHTMAILLAAARRLPWMEERFRKGAWREIQVPLAPLMEKRWASSDSGTSESKWRAGRPHFTTRGARARCCRTRSMTPRACMRASNARPW